jgi:hypothetical protein
MCTKMRRCNTGSRGCLRKCHLAGYPRSIQYHCPFMQRRSCTRSGCAPNESRARRSKGRLTSPGSKRSASELGEVVGHSGGTREGLRSDRRFMAGTSRDTLPLPLSRRSDDRLLHRKATSRVTHQLGVTHNGVGTRVAFDARAASTVPSGRTVTPTIALKRPRVASPHATGRYRGRPEGNGEGVRQVPVLDRR